MSCRLGAEGGAREGGARENRERENGEKGEDDMVCTLARSVQLLSLVLPSDWVKVT